MIPEDCKGLSILASYDGPFDEVGFTIKAYSPTAISWDKQIPKVPFSHKVWLWCLDVI